MVRSVDISYLFDSVKSLIKHQQEIEKLRGERFNIFSVLKMEYKETSVHSALLAELLNPEGTHAKGAIFLRLFLTAVGKEHCIDIASSSVKIEHAISGISETGEEGGRIDILLKDGAGKTIVIENKINAGDQDKQVLRYFNFNRPDNTVLYLTPDGREPSPESSRGLKSGTDFHCLSYRDDIRQWLELCLKEAADAPMLRESIKQYINLIKKMTSTPGNEEEKKLTDLMLRNFEVAAYIKDNFYKAKQEVGQQIREAVLQRLKTGLAAEFDVTEGAPITSRYAQIWLWHAGYDKPPLHFGIEPFNGIGNFGGDLFVGVYNRSGMPQQYAPEFSAGELSCWYNIERIKLEDCPVNFGNEVQLGRIIREEGYREKLVDEICTRTIDFIARYKELVKEKIKQPV